MNSALDTMPNNLIVFSNCLPHYELFCSNKRKPPPTTENTTRTIRKMTNARLDKRAEIASRKGMKLGEYGLLHRATNGWTIIQKTRALLFHFAVALFFN
jgi:hypothetical protein